MVSKPTELYDRVEEWAALTEFVSDPDPGTVLGIVYGRRRQGKTLLLELLTEAMGGFTFTGLQQANSQNLADIAAAYAGFAGVPSAAFSNWTDAVEALLTVGGRLGRPVPVVLDEFPYLVEQAPELPSVLQRVHGDARAAGGERSVARPGQAGTAGSALRLPGRGCFLGRA
jgi:AAA+ ATPase superfamily predicted ATPase